VFKEIEFIQNQKCFFSKSLALMRINYLFRVKVQRRFLWYFSKWKSNRGG